MEIYLTALGFGAAKIGVASYWAKTMRPIAEARDELFSLYSSSRHSSIRDAALDGYVLANSLMSLSLRWLGAVLHFIDTVKKLYGVFKGVSGLSKSLMNVSRSVSSTPLRTPFVKVAGHYTEMTRNGPRVAVSVYSFQLTRISDDLTSLAVFRSSALATGRENVTIEALKLASALDQLFGVSTKVIGAAIDQ